MNDGGLEKNFFSTIKKFKINDKSGIFQLDKFPQQVKLIFSFLFLIYYNFRNK